MNEPSAAARKEQELHRLAQQARSIKRAWHESEWVLNLLRAKAPDPGKASDERILKWARQHKIV